MKSPTIYTTETLNRLFQEGPRAGLPDGRWVPARPEGWGGLGLKTRLKAAWLVFTGRADVVRWEGQPEIAIDAGKVTCATPTV